MKRCPIALLVIVGRLFVFRFIVAVTWADRGRRSRIGAPWQHRSALTPVRKQTWKSAVPG